MAESYPLDQTVHAQVTYYEIVVHERRILVPIDGIPLKAGQEEILYRVNERVRQGAPVLLADHNKLSLDSVRTDYHIHVIYFSDENGEPDEHEKIVLGGR